MLTQCPGCQTVFRVTSTILRAAHGQVRCGRCNTQFDAIERLMEGAEAEQLEQANPPSEPALEKLAHEDIVLEGNRIEISGVYQRVDAEAGDTAATHSHTIIEEFNIDTQEWENPFNEGKGADAQPADSDETELEDVEQALNAESLSDAIASLDKIVVEPDINEPASETLRPKAESLRTPPLGWTQEGTEPDPFTAPAPRRWPWLVASSVLSLLLLGQALHHSRQALARHPSFGPVLSNLYAALGHPLEPQWQLQAYSIKQWGIVADPQEPGSLRVRASITNGANFAQPYPLLQLTLEDRFGSKMGERAFTPQEYLDHAAQASRLLAAGEAANVDLAIVDPGQEAVGFQFDTCLQLKQGLRCAHAAGT